MAVWSCRGCPFGILSTQNPSAFLSLGVSSKRSLTCLFWQSWKSFKLLNPDGCPVLTSYHCDSQARSNPVSQVWCHRMGIAKGCYRNPRVPCSHDPGQHPRNSEQCLQWIFLLISSFLASCLIFLSEQYKLPRNLQNILWREMENFDVI